MLIQRVRNKPREGTRNAQQVSCCQKRGIHAGIFIPCPITRRRYHLVMSTEKVFLGAMVSVTSRLQDTPDLHALVGIYPCAKTIGILVRVCHEAGMGEKSPS